MGRMTMVILLAFFALFAMVSAADDGGPWARVEAFFAKNKAEAAQAEGRFHLSPEVAAGLENVLSQCRQEVQKTVGDAKDLPFCAVWFSNFRSIGGFVVVTDGTIVACNDVPPILRSKENVKTAPADAKTAAHLQAAAQATAAMQSRDWNDYLIVHDGAIYFFCFNVPGTTAHSFIVPSPEDDDGDIAVEDVPGIITIPQDEVRLQLARLMKWLDETMKNAPLAKPLF